MRFTTLAVVTAALSSGCANALPVAPAHLKPAPRDAKLVFMCLGPDVMAENGLTGRLRSFWGVTIIEKLDHWVIVYGAHCHEA